MQDYEDDLQAHSYRSLTDDGATTPVNMDDNVSDRGYEDSGGYGGSLSPDSQAANFRSPIEGNLSLEDFHTYVKSSDAQRRRTKRVGCRACPVWALARLKCLR